MKLQKDWCFTVYSDKNNFRTGYIHKDCEYPETKEEGVQELCSSYQVIIDELVYKLGCVHYLRAPLLRPNSKRKWFDSILEVMDNMDEIYNLLRKHLPKPIDAPKIPWL